MREFAAQSRLLESFRAMIAENTQKRVDLHATLQSLVRLFVTPVSPYSSHTETVYHIAYHEKRAGSRKYEAGNQLLSTRGYLLNVELSGESRL